MDVAIILAAGFEEIEAITPIDLLRRAKINTTIISLNSETVKGAHNISIKADEILNEKTDKYDAYILPGGMPGAENLAKSKPLSALLKTEYENKKLIAAICASPAIVLAKLRILENKKATCYPSMEKHFSEQTQFIEKDTVVDENIITSRGVGTAINFSLAIIQYLLGNNASENIKESILC